MTRSKLQVFGFFFFYMSKQKCKQIRVPDHWLAFLETGGQDWIVTYEELHYLMAKGKGWSEIKCFKILNCEPRFRLRVVKNPLIGFDQVS